MPSGLFDSLGASFGPIASYALAAVIVFVLILVVLAVAKRALRPGAAGLGVRKGPRLAVIDVTPVDQRRKLVLVRRDDVEHLVLIGGQNDLVVEGNILRTPSPARVPGADRAAAMRLDPEAPTAAPPNRPVVVAPEPRQQMGENEVARAASPLRRPLPQQQPAAPSRASAAGPKPAPPVVAPPAPPSPPPPVEVPAARPAPLLEPAIVSEAPPSAPIPVADPLIQPLPPARPAIPHDEERRVPTPAVPTAAPSRPIRSTSEDVSPAVDEGTAARDPAPAIPAFLRRNDSAPVEQLSVEGRMAAPPSPMAPPVPPTSRSAPGERPQERLDPTVGVGQADPRPQAPEPMVAAPRLDSFNAPVVGPVEPVPPVAAPIAPPPRTETSGPTDDGERRPLSVRSFASAIQSRRSVPEPAAQPRPPVVPDRARPVPVVAAPTDRNGTPASPAATPQTEDGGLDDALSRELASGLGSLDWAGETRAKVAAPVPPSETPPVGRPTAERRPTLEEEMERLLGDLDLGPPRR